MITEQSLFSIGLSPTVSIAGLTSMPVMPWHGPRFRGPPLAARIFLSLKLLYYIIILSNIIILYHIMGHWDSRPKLAVNVTDKLITLLLMLIYLAQLLVFPTLNI